MNSIRFVLGWISVGLVALTAACTSIPEPSARRAAAVDLAAQKNWRPLTLQDSDFPLLAFVPSLEQTSIGQDLLTIYIEGDGYSWINSETPSADPTPVRPTGLLLALAQPEGPAAYLGRPCQYLSSSACFQPYWTQQRFSEPLVAAMNRAMDALKQQLGASRLRLVGYSGGAAMAVLIAERRNDVAAVVTVAGNLDTEWWTRVMHLSPLTGSLNPADQKLKLQSIAQWHFVGARDQVIPAELSESFVEGMPAARRIVLPEYDHYCCWVENWANLWRLQK